MRPQDMVEAGLAAAGDCDMTVIVTESSQVNLRWAANSLTTNGDTTATQVDVVAMHPTGGTATTSGHVADSGALGDLVARARAAATANEPPEDRRPLPQGGEQPNWDAPQESSSADVLTALATGLGHVFRRAGDIEHFGYAEQDATTTYLGTTSGARLRHHQRQGRAEFTAKAGGRTRSAWSGGSDPELALDVAAVDDGLRRGLDHQRTTVPVEPGHHRVILSPSATADLMIDMYFSADARSAMEGRSAFASGSGGTRIGDSLGSGVTLSSDPFDQGPGMACTPFEVAATSSDSASTFDNGLPLGATDWISDGVLRNLITSRHTADELGTNATPGIDNLRLAVSGASGGLSDLVARTEDALLITCLWYNRVVDPRTLLLTGLTRDGVYVVRDGRIVGSCGNFRFNESPVSLLGRIVDTSREERTLAREMGDYFNRASMPALVVEDFNLSTASEAH